MTDQGWISLWRRLRYWRFWPTQEKRPFTKVEAWIDLLFEANHETRAVGEYLIKRGQILTSQQKLAKRWRWSEGRVRRFLQTLSLPLVDDNLTDFGSEIEVRADRQSTVITIRHYDDYQAKRRTDDVENGGPTADRRRTDGDQTATNNNDNNGNNGNHSTKDRSLWFSEVVRYSPENVLLIPMIGVGGWKARLASFVAEFGQQRIEEALSPLSAKAKWYRDTHSTAPTADQLWPWYREKCEHFSKPEQKQIDADLQAWIEGKV